MSSDVHVHGIFKGLPYLSTCSSLLVCIAVQWRAPASYPQLHPGLEGSLGQEKLFRAAEQFCYQLLMYADVQWVLAPQLAL